MNRTRNLWICSQEAVTMIVKVCIKIIKLLLIENLQTFNRQHQIAMQNGKWDENSSVGKQARKKKLYCALLGYDIV
jgi:hypothetical protein